MGYRERRLARADRLRGWAGQRTQRSAAAFTGARDALAGIEPGQPILVGHHSERRHRAALERHDSRMRAGIESQQKADRMTSKADEIERQADTSIYSDDEDAIDRLRDKLAGLEAQRDRIRLVNKAVRKDGITSPVLTDAERAALITLERITPYHKPLTTGFPAYELTNLGGTISRTRKRIAALSGQQGAQTATPAPEGATAIERAGLIVTAGQTSPSRPGKAPRPVWTVTGNLGAWRPVLMRLGGQWYRGAFSFWDDPADALERAILEHVSTPIEAPTC